MDGSTATGRQGRLSYALNGARNNPEMESFNGHFKQEGNSLFLDACNMGELKIVIARQMEYHNTKRRHSSLDYVASMTYKHRLRMYNFCGKPQRLM
ncbi:integrase core domain-containing protein [Candidatus Poribacteria bacterium]